MQPRRILVLTPSHAEQTSLFAALRDFLWPGEAEIHVNETAQGTEKNWDMAFVIVTSPAVLETARGLRNRHPDMPLFFVGETGGIISLCTALTCAIGLLAGGAALKTFSQSNPTARIFDIGEGAITITPGTTASTVKVSYGGGTEDNIHSAAIGEQHSALQFGALALRQIEEHDISLSCTSLFCQGFRC